MAMEVTWPQIDTDERDRSTAPARAPKTFPRRSSTVSPSSIGKPRLRGWIHVYSAVVAFIAGATLVSVSWAMESTRAGLATLLYTLHDRGHVRRQRHLSPGELEVGERAQVDEAADHSMIFVFIAGSYTPFALLALPSSAADGCCSGSSGAGRSPACCSRCSGRRRRAGSGVPLYLLLGWVAVWFVGPIMHGAGVAALVLLIVGGALYSIGGVLYAPEVAQPVADDVRPPRVLPRLHRGRGDLPLHRDVVRRLQRLDLG